jgi:hypothetical protein
MSARGSYLLSMALTGKRLEFPSQPRTKMPGGVWAVFERRLAETLAALEEDQYLVVSAKRGWAYVQFAAQGAYGLRAECMSNNYLDAAHALSARQIARLDRMGWSAPTGTLEEILKKRRKGGSPNFFRDFARPVPCADAARMAVRTLTEVFAIQHPGYLVYKAFDKKERTILVPTLGLKREEPAPAAGKPRKETVAGLRKLVLKAIREASGNADLELDADGDVAVRFGSAVVYVRGLRGQRGLHGAVRSRARGADLPAGGPHRRGPRQEAAEGVRGAKGVRGNGGRGGAVGTAEQRDFARRGRPGGNILPV